VTATAPLRPSRRRRDVKRLGAVYAYTVADHDTRMPMPDDYVGQSRNQPQRDRQHRGLAAERDGVVRQKPWADLIVSVRIVEQGMWTNAELNEREQWWINHLSPRLNKSLNEHNPNRLPIYVQHQQRKARDPNWVIPDWSRPRPSGSVPNRPAPSRPVPSRLGTVWRWLSATLAFRAFVSWLLLALAVCVGVAWGAHTLGHLAPLWLALGVGAGLSLSVHVKYRQKIRRPPRPH
jgi:hypothetical protein